MVYEEYYVQESEDRGIAELIITSHRNGPVGTSKCFSNRNLGDIEI